MPSTPAAYPQVVSRTFASFRVPKFGVLAGHGHFCAGFDSRQLHRNTGERYRGEPGNSGPIGSVGGCAAAAIVAWQQGNKWSWLHLDRGSMGAQCNRPALRALNRSSSRWSGWATAMRRWARSLRLAPRSSATPYSVTTWSTVFLSVVTTLPWVRADRMRPRPVLVVECSTRNAFPPGEYIAPRAKSACPPDEDQ